MDDRDRAMLCSLLRNTVGEITYEILPLQFLLSFFHFIFSCCHWCDVHVYK